MDKYIENLQILLSGASLSIDIRLGLKKGEDSMLFNEKFVENNQAQNTILHVRDAGVLQQDSKYVIEREDSPTNVIGYIVSGTLHVEIYDKSYQVYNNTCFILPHRTKYRMYSDPDFPCVMIWVNVRGSLIESMLPILFEAEQFIVADYNFEKDYVKITSLMPKYEDQTTTIMKILTNMLIDISDNIHKPKVYEKTKKKVSTSMAMERYILNRVQFGFNVKDMANYFSISTDQLNRKFKEEFGTTPYQYYQKVRIDLVKSMLVNTDLSIDEISDRLGYSNRNNFSARFNALTGDTPVNYRKTNRY